MCKASSATFNINLTFNINPYSIVPKYRKPILTGKVKSFVEDQETIAQTKRYKMNLE
ncbi:MAG: hypothetical protein WB988_17775 [Candidatus Nitrosopolaris sp.]